jgi:hypothetical protein
MAREASWAKVKKAIALWKMPPDFWTAIEKGLQHYIRNTSQNNKGAAAPFPGTFNNPWNLLRRAFREQDEIGWSGILKGRITAPCVKLHPLSQPQLCARIHIDKSKCP